jgi:outer membrane protein
MKRLLTTLVLAAILIGAGSVSAQTNAKLGYIDSNKLIELMPGRDTIQQNLQVYQKELENMIKAMYAEYQGKIQDYQTNMAGMLEIIKKTKEKEIVDLESRIKEFEQVRNAIKAVADENGYIYIFDASVGVLLYFEKGDNVLPLVKAKLGL